MAREPYTYPDLLTVVPDGWVEQCAAEEDSDIRHIGRYLTYEYICPECGPHQMVQLTPDYPYCGPNSVWTCKHCASVMKLSSPEPVVGTPKNCDRTVIRKNASDGA